MGRIVLGVLCALLWDAAPAIGQAGEPQPAPDGQTAPATPAVDPAKLPLSIERVRKALATPAPRINVVDLKLEEFVQVVAVAPPLKLFDEEEARLVTGPVPYGAPTHRDSPSGTRPRSSALQRPTSAP